jgi:hypothetical protein
MLLVQGPHLLHLGASMKMSDNAPLHAIIIAIAVTVGGVLALKLVWELGRYVLGH